MKNLPRVTSIIGIINSDSLNKIRGQLGNYGFDEMMNRKAHLGDRIHKDSYLINEGLVPSPDPDTEIQVNAYWRWFDLYVEEVIASEIQLTSTRYGYMTHGVDLIAVLKGDKLPTTVDLKSGVTTGQLREKHKLQTASYKNLAKENGIKTIKRGIVNLKNIPSNGIPRFITHDNYERDLRHFFCALELYQRFGNNNK
jgi:hypothetical protein